MSKISENELKKNYPWCSRTQFPLPNDTSAVDPIGCVLMEL